MDRDRWSSLARPVDPRYPSNRLVLIGAGLAGLAVGVATLFGANLKAGAFSAAVAVFLAWAMARELDPDHPASAAIAMPVSLVVVLVVGPPALLVTFGVLLGLRIAAGSVGTPLRPLDFIAVIGLSAALGTSLIGAVGSGAMITGILVGGGRSPGGIATAAMSAIAYAVMALLSGLDRVWSAPTSAEWFMVGVAATATLLVLPAAAPASRTDRHTGSIDRNRVTAARAIAGMAILAGLALAGGPGVVAIAATAAAALVAVALRRVVGFGS